MSLFLSCHSLSPFLLLSRFRSTSPFFFFFFFFSLQTQQSRTVNQLHFVSWPSDLIVPQSTNDVINFVETIVNLATNSEPILLHCSAGTDRCSLIVTLATLLKQIHSEARVDVFQSARCTRSQRPAMLQMLVSISQPMTDIINAESTVTSFLSFLSSPFPLSLSSSLAHHRLSMIFCTNVPSIISTHEICVIWRTLICSSSVY